MRRATSYLKPFIKVVLVGVLLSPSFVFAQKIDPAALRQGVRESLPEIPAYIPEDIIPERFKDKVESKDYDIRVLIKSFDFEGNTRHSDQELSEFLADEIGKAHDFNSLVRIAKRVTDYFRERGAFVARTYIPVQSLDRPVLKLRIVEGVIEAVDLENNSKTSDKAINDILEVIGAGNVLERVNLERAMILLNEMSGVQGRSFLSAGKAPGTTRVGVKTESTDKFNGYVAVNNHSSDSTGRYGGVLNLRTENIFHRGGYLDLLGTLTRAEGSFLLGLSLFQPIGYADWSVKFDYNFIDTETVYGEFSPLGLSSRNHVGTLTFIRPIIRDYVVSLDYHLGLTYEKYEQENISIDDTFKDELHTLFSYIRGSRKDDYGSFNGRLHLETGLKNIRPEASDLFAAGDYVLLQYDISRLQALNKRISLLARLQGQLSQDRLLSVKQFAVGGSQRVRAFNNSEGLGESGHAFNLELRYMAISQGQLWDWLNQVEPYTFFDMGQSNTNEALPGQNHSRFHQGYGLGTRSFLFKNKLSLDINYATRAGRDRALSDDKKHSRFWGQAVFFFKF